MLSAIAMTFLGLLLLLGGGELLVRGAVRIAAMAGVSTTVIGLTVVAMGTSLPELVVSIGAVLRGSPAVAIGNIVGSNVFNIGAIIGLTAVITPMRISGNVVRFEYPVMLLSSLAFLLFASSDNINRIEGSILTGGLLAFLLYTTWVSRLETTPAETEQIENFLKERTPTIEKPRATSWMWQAALIAGGLGLLIAGSNAFVRGASAVASEFGASEVLIGLTIVAAGTSLPELATSAVAAFRGQDDVAIANVLGSNIFNVLGIAGITALVCPLQVPTEIIERDIWWMLGLSFLMFPLMKSGLKISRGEGTILLGIVGVYFAVLVA